MANKRILYDFCPECGGLMKDGVCLACGYEKKANGPAAVRPADHTAPADGVSEEGRAAQIAKGSAASGNGAYSGGGSFDVNALQTPARKKYTGLIIGGCVGGVIFLGLFCLAVYLIVSGVRAAASKDKDARTDEIAGSSGLFSSEEPRGYVPDPSDEYYVEFADAVREDLPYRISWMEYHAENEDGTDYFRAVYPAVEGEFPNADRVNGELKDLGLRSLSIYQYLSEEEDLGSCEVYSSAYVTLMDEEVLSVLYAEYIYIDGVYLPGIYDLNVDAETGEVLEHEEMISYTAELAERVCSQNAYQNSTDLDEVGLTQEAVLELLRGEDGVAFYTPVGLELGFNYNVENGSYGWLTVTIKDYEKYKK